MAISRREVVSGFTASLLLKSYPGHSSGLPAKKWDVIVVGAGVFGAWTAEKLRRAGKQVLLVDAWGPANTRASSGGESRMTRCGYGADKIYTKMALASLEEWKRLSHDQVLPLFHNTGVLSFFDKENDYASDSLQSLAELNIPVHRYEPAELRKRWPQIDWAGIEFAVHEPGFGALMARRGVATLVQSFLGAGGSYQQATIVAPPDEQTLTSLTTLDGEVLKADQFVFACGPWLAKLFPALLKERLFATQQEVYYFRPQSGDSRYKAPAMPGWSEFIDSDIYYGFPDLEHRGFKIADDAHGPIVDYDSNDRVSSQATLDKLRAYMGRRFPGMANAPLSGVRVCQYGNSASGDFLIDRHPNWPNAVLVGMGSGHGFKHGPELGRMAAELLLGSYAGEPRFSLSSKAKEQNRSVH